MTKHDDELRQVLEDSIAWHPRETYPLRVGPMRFRGWAELAKALRLWLPAVEAKAKEEGDDKED